MVEDQVDRRPRCQRRQLLEKLHRLEEHLVPWLQAAAPQEPPHALPDRVEQLRHLPRRLGRTLDEREPARGGPAILRCDSTECGGIRSKRTQ